MTGTRQSASTATRAITRRDEIIEQATNLFAEYGYHAVGMRAIAAAVGVRSSSLYHHFPSKQAILAAIASEATHAFVSQYAPILESDDPPDERLRIVLRAHILFYWEHRLRRQVGLTNLRELREENPALYDQIMADLRRYRHGVTQTIEDGLRCGTFTAKSDAKILSTAVIAIVVGVNDWFHEGDELTIDQVANGETQVVVDDLLGARRRRRR